MEDLKAKLEKLRMEAEDCAILGKLAADQQQRDLFNKLADNFRSMARDIEAVIALRDHRSK